MAESTLRGYDPYAYHVNNVSDFNRDVVTAFQDNNRERLDVLLAKADKLDYDVFICVNNSYHAFILITSNPDDIKERDILKIHPDMSTKPEDIPLLLLVHLWELCYEDSVSKMYKIRWKVDTFVNVKDKIKRAYFIGHFKDLSIVAFQLAALEASAKRYSIMLDDCVEFAKKMCLKLLNYASNGNTLVDDVKNQIRSATASGFTAEKLSREIRSSAYFMNSFLGSLDVSSFFLQGRARIFCVLIGLVVFLIYPVLIYWLMSSQK